MAVGPGVWAPLRLELTQPEQLLNTQQEAGAADATDQNGDLHLTFTGLDSTAQKVLPNDEAVGRSGPVVTDTPKNENNRNAEN